MKIFDSTHALGHASGLDLGTSPYLVVSQEAIDQFASATGDHQWIHVGVDRARREMPEGKTIAHGYLTLSLIPRLAAQLYSVAGAPKALNYGLNRVRFLSPVPAGSQIRLRLKIAGCESSTAGVRVTMENVLEIEGSDKPALIAETIVFYPAQS